jgi:hypothetical protein
MTTIKQQQLQLQQRKSGTGIRLSYCLPIFLMLCVTFNVLVVGWWLLSDNNAAPLQQQQQQRPAPSLKRVQKEQQPTKDVKINTPVLARGSNARQSSEDKDHLVDKQSDEKISNTEQHEEGNVEETIIEEEETIDEKDKNADAPLATVAHVVSLIKCSKSVTGFLDAAAVFRHSIHQQSFHAGKSKYAYQMYAIVHEQCQEHGELLKILGYTVLVKPAPVLVEEIQDGWYKNHVENENCCGSAEFIKLYAYELTDHEIVVHWDMDVALLQPMDDLFDAMLFSKDSDEGKAARSRLEVQHPEVPLPDVIDAYFTRDITSAQPWESVQGVQGGFLIARPSKKDLETYLQFIRQGNYTPGRGDGSGWNSLGYGGFQGAMAYQGAVAFFYDFFKPKTAVELAACRWNQVVADVLWRGPAKMEHHMQCREHPLDGNYETNTDCEDCRITPIDLVKSVHYTACKKPWECQIPHPRVPRDKNQVYRLSHLTNITTCGNLFAKWFELRQDLEQQLSTFGVDPVSHEGNFNANYFLGYCSRSGGYIPMNAPPDGFDWKQIYGI